MRANGGGKAEPSGASCDRAKGGIEHVRVNERSQLPCTNVRTITVDGTHGTGRALEVLSVYDRLGCHVIGLQ